MTRTEIVICTDVENMATFVGARTIGHVTADVPATHAYTYDSVIDAADAARSLGLRPCGYMVGTLADFT